MRPAGQHDDGLGPRVQGAQLAGVRAVEVEVLSAADLEQRSAPLPDPGAEVVARQGELAAEGEDSGRVPAAPRVPRTSRWRRRRTHRRARRPGRRRPAGRPPRARAPRSAARPSRRARRGRKRRAPGRRPATGRCRRRPGGAAPPRPSRSRAGGWSNSWPSPVVADTQLAAGVGGARRNLGRGCGRGRARHRRRLRLGVPAVVLAGHQEHKREKRSADARDHAHTLGQR